MEDSEPKGGPHVDLSRPRHQTSRHRLPRRAQVLASSHEAVDPTLSVPFTPLFRELMEAAPVAAFVKDADGRYVYANPYLLAAMGKQMGSDWHGKTDADMWPPEAAAMMLAHDEAILRGDGSQVFSRVMALDDGLRSVWLVEFPLVTGDSGIGVGGIGIDISEPMKNEAEHDRLVGAIEQVAESVVIADREARITYVNPAFEEVTGYSRHEVTGQNLSLLQSGLQPPSFYDAMWAVLTSGQPWTGDLESRRKDGSLFTEEAVISPIRDPSGAINSYVAVKRDVTREREFQERSVQLARERALIADTIRGRRAGDTPEATAQAICRRVVGLPDVMAAQLAIFGLDGRAWPIGFFVEGQPDPPLRRLPEQRSRHLRERAAEGPWIEPWVSRHSNPYHRLLNGLGVRALACAPVRHDQAVIGLLVVYVKGSVGEVAVTEVLPALAEFADLAGALIGRDVGDRTEVGRSREYVLDIIGHRAFQPVFQPIVEFGRSPIVGYEALTRFNDGTDPEIVFAKAAAVGLGPELEIITLQAALAAAKALPRSAWLNLNTSPELILAGEPLSTLLGGSRRRLVLEVTEHTAIADYPAFRAAMAALGPSVELAVDDAGAGFASLRHILELRPAFVKLDRSLVAGLESDYARHAMIAGLRHFARATGFRLIAEGIETDQELAILRALDIQLGQGFLLGRPLAVDDASKQVLLA